MSLLDIVILLIVVMFGIIGFKRGVIKESISLIGIIIIFVIAFIFKESLGNIMCKYLPFFQFGGTLKGLVSINILIYQLIAFLLIYSVLFSLYAIILKLSGIIQKIVNMTIILLLPSKLAGLLIGLIKGYVIVFIALLVIMISLKDNGLLLESKWMNKIVYKTPVLSKNTSSLTKSITEVYDLGEKLKNKELTTNEANLKTIDAMLKYKVVSPKTIKQLVVLDKLKGVKGINNIVSKYK